MTKRQTALTIGRRSQAALPAKRGCRDRELIEFVGRYGIVSIDHVQGTLSVGRTAAYGRVASCVEAGLLERLTLLRTEPSLLRATRAGLRYAGLGLPVAPVSPGAVGHWLRCGSTALLLGERYGNDQLITERELVLAERIEGSPIASAKLGELPGGGPRLHRPDLVIADGGRLIAVEVELTPKAPRRLEAIVRAWRRASWVAEVHYHCEPGPTRRGLERAVERTRAERRVRIFEAVPR